MIQPEQNQICHLIVEQQIRNSQFISSQKLCLVEGQLIIQRTNGIKHFFVERGEVYLQYRFLSHHCSQVQSYRFEKGQSELALVPGDELVDYGSLFKGGAYKMFQMRIYFAEVDHDGSTFSKGEVSVLENRYFSNRVQLEVLFASLFSLEDVYTNEGAWYFTNVDESFHCPAWLTSQSPAKCQRGRTH